MPWSMAGRQAVCHAPRRVDLLPGPADRARDEQVTVGVMAAPGHEVSVRRGGDSGPAKHNEACTDVKRWRWPVGVRGGSGCLGGRLSSGVDTPARQEGEHDGRHHDDGGGPGPERHSPGDQDAVAPVSYTHLTLPTNREV